MSGCEAYFLVGPTASGKTAVAHALARKLGLEILSADAMLVYRGFDIGTAKPTTAERAGLHYHGIDLVSPAEDFSVGTFLQHARQAFAECHRRGHRMLVAGGTGLYVKALLEGLDSDQAPDPARRRYWNQRLAAEGLASLQATAEQLCPGILARMADAQNPRRLVRVLERLEEGLDPLPSPAPGADAPPPQDSAAPWPNSSAPGLWQSPDSATSPPLAGLWFEPPELNRRIAQRIELMFAAGLLAETERLRSEYPVWSETARGAIGYAEALAVLAGDMTLTEARERIAARTRQLAKRQRTWYRHQLIVSWIGGPADATDVARAAAAVERIWLQHGPQRIRCFENLPT